jgi:hypothetical protein
MDISEEVALALAHSLEKLGGCPLGDPVTRQGLQVAHLVGDAIVSGIDLAQDIINVHGGDWR